MNDVWNSETDLNDPNTTATINFTPPCSMNGKFKQYEIYFRGSRKEKDDHSGLLIQTTIRDQQSETLLLLPDREYEFQITVVTELYSTTHSAGSIKTKPGGKLICFYTFYLES